MRKIQIDRGSLWKTTTSGAVLFDEHYAALDFLECDTIIMVLQDSKISHGKIAVLVGDLIGCVNVAWFVMSEGSFERLDKR